MVQAYRSFLIRATGSKLLDRVEKALNYVCPKSLILYADKPAATGVAARSTCVAAA